MKNTIILWLVASFSALIAQTGHAYEGSTFGDVWRQVKSDPYMQYPQKEVTVLSFFRFGVNLLKKDAKRTIETREDLLPPFSKLVHPIGVCLAGEWMITEDSPYSGYFKKGSHALVIARASSALGYPYNDDYRSLGLAVKIFPTIDPSHTNPLKTANFFTIDDLGGEVHNSFLDTVLTSEPNSSLRPSIIAIGLAAGSAIGSADKNPGRRQLYEVAELGEPTPQLAVSPGWIQISSQTAARTGFSDFRDELAPFNYPGGRLVFDISVTDQKSDLYTSRPRKIGVLVFSDATASQSCDTRLHFHHPRFRD